MGDLFGAETEEPRTKGKRSYEAGGYARRPGSGPAGETCKTCEHCCRVSGGNGRFFKCDVIKHRWTCGPGTDVRLKSPACELWEAEKPRGRVAR